MIMLFQTGTDSMDTSDAPSTREASLDTSLDPPSQTYDGSRWWYWIAAYPIYSLLAIPVAIFGLILFAPVGATMPTGDPQFMGPIVFAVIALVIGVSAIYALLGLILTLLLPVALYIDASEITASDVTWSPDPTLYGLVGLLNFLAAPIVGIIIAVYYLYRRHEHIGTP